ncbi:MAG: ABC transporter permease [Chloroflexi bacterium]|nr:ABC transporter permease [Chloroflexota bacterium]HCU80553.1 ABC transporter permease [Chloroflexota bacterium]
MDFALIASIVSIALAAGTSLVYATVGEILTERAGILNLGVEGIMIMGAVTGFAAAFHTESVFWGVIVAMLVGAMMASIHAFVTITLLADQVVSGLAMTLLGTGLASFLGQRLGTDGAPLVGQIGPRFERMAVPVLAELGSIGDSVFNRDILTYLMYILVPIVWVFIYKLRAGLVLRSVGENPQASDAMGVDVFRVRYAYTIVGGMLVGLGGAHLSLSYTPGWTENITGGRGWIAVALVIFATWDPIRSVAGALLFGGVNAIQFRLQAAGTTIPASLLNMLPYILTIVVLVIVTWFESLSKRVGAPAALGIPYVREERV